MKNKKLYIILFFFILLGCQKSQEYYDGVFIVGADADNPTTTLTVDDLPSAIGVNVKASCVVDEDVTINMAERTDLVEHFNKTFKKNYELLPKACYQVQNTDLKIDAGKHASTEALKLEIVSREGLEEGVTYVLPISIAEVKGSSLSVIEGSKTIYVVVNQIIITQAANLRANGSYYKVDFRSESKHNTKSLKNVTYEARVRFKNFNYKWCYSIMGLEENLCLRTAGGQDEGWRLQIGGGAGITGNTTIPKDEWVHVACVYNGEKGTTTLYLNGEFDGEVPDHRPNGVDLTWAYGHDKNASFYIGQSATDNRYLEGDISEVRVWGVARTAAELKNNICWVDPTTEGLIGYWRFNNDENTVDGKTISDISGNGYNARYSGWSEPKWVDHVRCPDL
ncbi:DUF1735 and LamG domain-containing protein [Bacteroides sp.]|uniref:DUF1735 and LamG domain-containing protein n=1 Tax=Bacteroides sp. TaxID=29523 RepID=UPI0025865BB7|nr:DUF1735 and LamG domain-containing protein [Bacteroides sp.]